MKSRIYLIALVLLLALSINSYANVYATDVKVSSTTLEADGTATVTISFILNEAADNGVDVKIYNSDTDLIRTISLTTAPKGVNTVDWDGKDNGGTLVAVGDYSVEVTASDDGYTDWTKISDDTKTAIYSPRGIAVNRNPESPYFGRVYVTNKAAGTSTNTGAFLTDQGVLMYTQDQEFVGFSNGGVTWPASTSGSPHKVMVGPDDMVYVGDYASDLLYAFDADITDASQNLVIGATNKVDGQYVTGHWVAGTGADRAIYTADGHYGAYTGIKKYDIGLNDVMPDGNTGYEIINRPDGSYYQYDVELGSDGSVYMCQYRSAKSTIEDKDNILESDEKGPGEAYPIVKYKPWVDDGSQTAYTIDDTLWTVTKQMTDAKGIGLDEPRNRIAYGAYNSGNVYIFNATTGELVETVASGRNRTWDVAFDAVGNMYLIDNSSEYWTMISPPDGANSYTTPCLEKVTIEVPVQQTVFISELADPNNNSGLRFVELYNPTDSDIDLTEGSGWKLNKYTNASATVSQTLALTGTIKAKSCYVIATGVVDADFETGYSVAPDQFDGANDNVAGSNGDDNIELVDGTGAVVDLFGVPGEDGTGTNHEFEDGRAFRKATVTTGNPTWDVTEWSIDSDAPSGIGPVDAPDGFDPGVWPTIIPLEIAYAMSVSLTEIEVKYTVDVSTVNVADYSVLGTSGITFTTADIDAADATIVKLTSGADIVGDVVLDTLVDAAITDSTVAYLGITPIALTNATNPGGIIDDVHPATFKGIISANDENKYVWISDADGAYNGALIFDYSFDAVVSVGDEILITAIRDTYNNLTELTKPALLTTISSANTPYGPAEISGADIDTALAADTDPGEKWEGQLVKIDSATVLSYANYQYLCTDDDSATYFLVGDIVDYQFATVSMTVGDTYDIVGVVDYSGKYRINPRDAADIQKLVEPGDFDIIEDFTDDTDVANWRSENSGWTGRAQVDGMLCLSDGGWTFDARRTVVAEPNTFFKATAKIKTSGSFSANPTSQYIKFGIDGLGDQNYQVSCVSDSVFSVFTIIGYAVNDTGSLYIAGQGGAGADTVFVDEYSYKNNYIPELTVISTVAEARAVAVGQKLATIGVVTTTTNFGSSGPAYIQDETAGLAAYNYTAAQNVELGDEILVIGTMKDYNGLLEIDPVSDYIVLSQDNVVDPVVITAADMDGEAYEGMLVTIEKCDTLDTGLDWASTEGSNKGFSLKDGNDSTFYCYIDKDTDIDGSPKPMDWPLNITGIVGDYNGAQLLPRSLADFEPANKEPGAFTMLNPADSTVITSLEDSNLVKVLAGADSVLALFINWTTAVDPDPGDVVTYQVVISPDGPEEDVITTDTMVYIPIDEERPWKMNGSYIAYVVATDILGKTSVSDTVALMFDFPAPPEVIYADVVLVDGTPKLYAVFNMEFEEVAIANFMILDKDAATATAPTIVDSLDSVSVMISGDLIEDNFIALAYNGIVSPGGTVTTTDTAYAGEVLIPFSENHREDAINMITDFESDVGSFLAPNWSGSTTADDASTFAVSDEEAYRGTKSGKMTIVDNTATTGGWYVRELYGYPFAYTVKANSKLMFMVKGTDADVEIRLSITENPGYEQGPWTHVSVCENDWQVVSFDLLNDEAEGWINGNGIVEGETVEIEGIHMRCSEDVDVTLFIDEFTERQIVVPVEVTFEVNMAVQSLLGKFNIASDFVDIAGNLNDWGGNSMVLDDADGDSVYSITVTDLYPGENLEYKFRINGSWDDATCEFPSGGPNRTYVVPDTNSVVFHWYDDKDRSVLGIDDMNALPKVFALHQNYPNPFNPITTIKYELPKESLVKIIVFDLMGKEVRTLVSQKQNAGYQTVIWDALDNFGRQVSSGYYIYLMQAESFHKTQKMILLK